MMERPRSSVSNDDDGSDLGMGFRMNKRQLQQLSELVRRHGWTAFFIGAWFFFSFCTLILNKIILSELGFDSQHLGMAQMLSTAALGALKVYGFPLPQRWRSWRREDDKAHEEASTTEVGFDKGCEDGVAASDASSAVSPKASLRGLRLTLVLMAGLRYCTVLLGLVSLKHVAASFTETIKSTAPIFTVGLQLVVLRQPTSLGVLLSLVPVMAGLIVSARGEVAFNAIGFWAAVFNNVIDCLQNVLSKTLLRQISPVELQFYTSVLAIAIQLPMTALSDAPQAYARLIDSPRHAAHWFSNILSLDRALVAQLLTRDRLHPALFFTANVLSYHLQSVTAYFVVSKITPVSVSVANTLKRSLLIMLSVAYFGNTPTPSTVFGVATVILGVFLYNYARIYNPPESKN